MLLLFALEEPGQLTAAPHRLSDSVTLKEHLGHAWPNELVHCDDVFARGEVPSTDVHIVDGKGRDVAAQPSAVTRHPDGSIQKAQVWFLVSLQPGEVAQFKLQPGKSATAWKSTPTPGASSTM